MPSYTAFLSKSPTSVKTEPIGLLSVLASMSRSRDLIAWPSGTLTSTRWLAPSGQEPMVRVWSCPSGVDDSTAGAPSAAGWEG